MSFSIYIAQIKVKKAFIRHRFVALEQIFTFLDIKSGTFKSKNYIQNALIFAIEQLLHLILEKKNHSKRIDFRDSAIITSLTAFKTH